LDKAGRAVVDQDLSHPKHPEIFIIGDAAYVKDKKGNPLPAISPVAIQAAKHVAKIIKKQTPKEKRKPFKYFDKGTLATIGKYRAVGQIKGLKFKGIVAWFLWSFVHIVYLVGFSNKVVVLLQWMFYFIAGQRNVRVIVHPLPEDKSHKSGVVEEWERKPAPIQKEEHGIDQQNKAQ
jgi:NADH dehydrogenase